MNNQPHSQVRVGGSGLRNDRPVTPDKINPGIRERPITPDKIIKQGGGQRPISGINPINRQVTPDRIKNQVGSQRPISGVPQNNHYRQKTPDNIKAGGLKVNPSNRLIPSNQIVGGGRMKTPDKGKPMIIKKK
jgi:hypothetical protein